MQTPLMDADTLLTETETVHEQTVDHLRDSAHLFHDREGELFTHAEAIELLTTELDIDSSVARKVLTQLVGDHVDPVIQVNTDGTQYIGVVEFREFAGAYGYVAHHDLHGKTKCIVCQQCVNNTPTDSAVTRVTEYDLINSVADTAPWSELRALIHDHYASHTVAPADVDTSVETTGATLKSGTTIGGNLAFHKGNDGPESGLDADTLHGNGPGEFVTTKYTDAEASRAAPVQSVNGQTGDVTIGGTPVGGILMWSGNISTIPSGFTLCDGNGTLSNGDPVPDLQDRFVVGAGNQFNTTQTGGSNSVALSQAELPSHNHSVSSGNHSHGTNVTTNGHDAVSSVSTSDGEYEGGGWASPHAISSVSSSSGKVYADVDVSVNSSSASISQSNVGNNRSHENKPSYFAVAYIIKT